MFELVHSYRSKRKQQFGGGVAEPKLVTMRMNIHLALGLDKQSQPFPSRNSMWCVLSCTESIE